MEKRNCIIIHGCPSDTPRSKNPETRSYDKHWIPWLTKELNNRGIDTIAPLMPSPWKPVYADFKEEFEKYEVNQNTILIGHSCGCAFLVRWLGESKQRIKRLILVAPWKIPDEDSELKKDFYNYSIDESIKERVEEIIMFTADNEEEDGKKSLDLFHNGLGGKIINIPNYGHYCFNDIGGEELPELLEEVL